MSGIFGGAVTDRHLAWLIIAQLFVIIGLLSTLVHQKSSFSNPNDTQYANRYQAGPDGESLNDRMVAAQAKGVAAWQASQGNVSGLTGSRDVPVFFQDFDVEMQAKGGNIYNQREGFTSVFDKDCGIPGAC